MPGPQNAGLIDSVNSYGGAWTPETFPSSPTPSASAAPPESYTSDPAVPQSYINGPNQGLIPGISDYGGSWTPQTFAPISSGGGGSTGGTATATAPLAPARLSAAQQQAQFETDIRNSPQYKQALENVQLWNQQQQGDLNFNQGWADRFYQQNLSQIGAGDALARAADELNRKQGQQSLTTEQQKIAMEKAKAARDFEQQRKYVTESLTGRGNAGGQLGFEKGNLQFGYDQFLQGEGLNAQNAQFAYDQLISQLDLNRQGRDLNNQTNRSNLDLSYQQQVAETQHARENLALQVSQKNGEALLQVESQLAQLWFNPQTGDYIGPSGERVSVEQAAASTTQQTTTTLNRFQSGL